MQTLTLEQITKHIQRTGYPCWQLSIVRNFNKMPVMNYYGEDFDENDSTEKKCQKSVQHLQSLVSDFPPETVFTIELKTNAKATLSTMLGPFNFALDPASPAQPQQPQNGFNGFGAVPPGFVSEAYLNGKLAEVQAESKRELQEALFGMREREFNEKCQRREERLAEKERELKEEEKKYNTGTGQAADALYLAIRKIVMQFIPGAQTPTSNGQTLGEPTQTTPPPTEEITNTEKAAAVNKLANLLYESDKINLHSIEQLTQSINAKLNQNGFYHQQNSDTDIEGAGGDSDSEDFNED